MPFSQPNSSVHRGDWVITEGLNIREEMMFGVILLKPTALFMTGKERGLLLL